jgi:hypothetical protein
MDTLAKPVGGGVTDVQQVPGDQAKTLIDQGYYPVDSNAATGWNVGQMMLAMKFIRKA